MFNLRNTALALAAIASIGAASVLASSSAEARGFGGGGGGFSRGGGMHAGGGMHVGGGMRVGGGHFGGGIRRIGGGSRLIINRVPPRWAGHPHFRPHFRPNWCRFSYRCGPHIVRWPRPWVYGAVAATTYAVTPAVAAAPSCTCLKKEYTPDNLVVFSDVCTKEVASAPIGNTQATLPLPPQAPVQQ